MQVIHLNTHYIVPQEKASIAKIGSFFIVRGHEITGPAVSSFCTLPTAECK
jgi:hypothetical protein